jgi:hypothetical protein
LAKLAKVSAESRTIDGRKSQDPATSRRSDNHTTNPGAKNGAGRRRGRGYDSSGREISSLVGEIKKEVVLNNVYR